jgi:hypothetical protein
MQEPNHKGVKCWFPAMRENHARRLETPPHKNANAAEHRRTEAVADNRNNKPLDDAPLAFADEMSALGWSFRSRSTRIGTAMFDVDPFAESSFDDRFAAAFEVSSVTQPSIIQRMMDPVGAIP